jgi:hypothetical protein
MKVESGSDNKYQDLLLPPTTAVKKDEIKSGEKISAFGFGVPEGVTEILLSSSTEEGDASTVIKKEVKIAANGEWLIDLDTANLVAGKYKLKARIKKDELVSNYSSDIEIAVNQKLPIAVCKNADLNGDKKVNLIDFSILMYYWNTNNTCADQNKNGKVDLPDFSIMMYYWTG